MANFLLWRKISGVISRLCLCFQRSSSHISRISIQGGNPSACSTKRLGLRRLLAGRMINDFCSCRCANTSAAPRVRGLPTMRATSRKTSAMVRQRRSGALRSKTVLIALVMFRERIFRESALAQRLCNVRRSFRRSAPSARTIMPADGSRSSGATNDGASPNHLRHHHKHHHHQQQQHHQLAWWWVSHIRRRSEYGRRSPLS